MKTMGTMETKGTWAGQLPLGDGVIWWTGAIVFAVLAVAIVAVRLLRGSGRIGEAAAREVMLRVRTWAIIVPAVLVPVGFGPAGVRVATVGLGLLCFREFSRASGLAEDRGLSRAAMLAVAFFAGNGLGEVPHPAMLPGTFAALAVVGLFSCKVEVFLSRVSLAAITVAWFGICLGALGELARQDGRGLVVLWLILCVAFNDVAAFVGGKLLGGGKLCPGISPGKTISGAVVALLATTLLAGLTGKWFRVDDPAWLSFGLGFFVSLAGQTGDLAMSAVKRGLGIKDMGRLLPGHGGILDRVDSLLLAAPMALALTSLSTVFAD